MSAHGFKSVFMVASVAGAALGCYLVSLNVASERAKLEAVESEIVLAQREIRLLQTEIGTRGRLAQLERWNAGFIRLSAPTADQFLEGGFQLATMVRPAPKPTIEAPIVLASAPVDQAIARRQGGSDGDDARPVGEVPAPARSASDMMQVASYQRPPAAPKPAVIPPAKPAISKVASAKPAPVRTAAAKGTKVAASDTLAPLPAVGAAAKAAPPGSASASVAAPRQTKDSGTPR